MKDLKLSIDLLPKGAWNNDFSRTLLKNDWDLLRNECYRKANGKCQICSIATKDLNAHEVWDFNIEKKTQTLKDIIGICNKCHSVIHYKNSERLGFANNAKQHFMKVNNCSELEFAKNLALALIKFEEKNKIYRWKIIANLTRFCNKKIEIKEHYFPKIINPYIDDEIEELSNQCNYNPQVIELQVNNYQGEIKLKLNRTNKIEWFINDQIFTKKFNFGKTFNTSFCVKDSVGSELYFIIYNNNGKYKSKIFKLCNWD